MRVNLPQHLPEPVGPLSSCRRYWVGHGDQLCRHTLQTTAGVATPVASLSQQRTGGMKTVAWVCGTGADSCPLCLIPAGQSMRQLQLTYNDFFPDYFSLAEKPPAEFCLSPDGNTESISIDLLQKKGESSHLWWTM